MADSGFPRPIADVISTLVEIFEHQRRPELVELLRSANASIVLTDYDNWNGGTSTWALRLEVPVSVFASVEPRLEDIEKEIEKKLSYLDRAFPNDHLNSVLISPLAGSAATSNAQLIASDSDVKRLWPEGTFRLFLSHVSKHKAEVAQLKTQLSRLGVAAFVAHEDIEPSLEWQDEIELALRSMHALVALVTPDFSKSSWTDQEIGWALGRGLPVIPVRLGADPYGFAGKVQAVAGDLGNPLILADALIEVLRRNRHTHGEIKRAFVSAFEEAKSFAMAKALCAQILEIDDFTDDEIARLKNACRENDQVKGSFGLVSRIEKKFGAVAVAVTEVDDIPF